MKRWIVAVLVLTLMLSSLAGCASKKEEGTPTASQTPPAQQQQQSGDSRISDLMKSVSQAKQMSFDMVMTSSGQGQSLNTSGKMYISDKKVRMEMETMGMKMITITNAQGEVYMYNPEAKTAMKITSPQSAAELPSDWANEVDAMSKLKVVGEEKKDGYDCLVVTATEGTDTTKMWLRKDIGMPVRIEQTVSQSQVVMEYKNYKIGPQENSLFEIPAGTTITTMNVPQAPSGN